MRRTGQTLIPREVEQNIKGALIALLYFLACFVISSCSETVDRLKRVGKAPQFENIEIPTVEEDEEEIERREARLINYSRTSLLWLLDSSR